jgi:hypothetical protein
LRSDSPRPTAKGKLPVRTKTWHCKLEDDLKRHICISDTHTEAPDGSDALLVFVCGDFGLEGAALNSALEGPIHRSVSCLGGFEYKIVDVEMTKCGCICVPGTYTEAFYDSDILLLFAGGTLGLRGARNRALDGPIFRFLSGL